MEELKVKVGDKVLYHRWSIVANVEKIVTVTKVTPTGRVKIDWCDTQYDRYGREIGSRRSSSISIPTEEDYERIRENETISKAQSLMEKAKLTYEQAVKIIEILESENADIAN